MAMNDHLLPPFSTGTLGSAQGGALESRFVQWRSWRPCSRFTIAARITALALTLAVPLNLVIIAVIWHLSEAASQTQRTALLYTARSVAAAVDAKLGEYLALANTLARSPALLEDDLDAFEAEARRAFMRACVGVSSDTWARARGWAVMFGVMLAEAGQTNDLRLGVIGAQALQRLTEDL